MLFYENGCVISRWSRDASELMDPNYQGIYDGKFQLSDDTAPMKDSIHLFVSQTDIGQDVKSALQQMMRPLIVTAIRNLAILAAILNSKMADRY